jgi:hypothetical protein
MICEFDLDIIFFLGSRPPRDISCRIRRNNNTKDERVPKAKLEMDRSLTTQEYQKAQDELKMDDAGHF